MRRVIPFDAKGFKCINADYFTLHKYDMISCDKSFIRLILSDNCFTTIYEISHYMFKIQIIILNPASRVIDLIV